MQKEFLTLYNDELQAFRKTATEFSHDHPDEAGHLRLSDGLADDPHVERLIESFVFTAARIRQKLEDSFPELSAGLLDALYPQLLAPQPSMSIVTITPSSALTEVQYLSRSLEILSCDIDGDKCRFKTTQPMEIVPAKIEAANYETDRFELASSPFSTAQSVLNINIAPLKHETNLSSLGIKKLRFYLSGAWDQASLLYMCLFSNALGICLSDADGSTPPIILSAEHIVAVGFSEEEALLPSMANFNIGFRLLSEFFALKQKFLFFDIYGLEKWQGKTLNISLYFDRSDAELKKNISLNSLKLNTTPIINIFSQQCEPLQISGGHSIYNLIADLRFIKSRKIHSIESVSVVSGRDAPKICHSAYAPKIDPDTNDLAWQMVRGSDDDGSGDKYIAFSGAALDGEKQFVSRINALCYNADLPTSLPYNSNDFQLNPAIPNSFVASIHCLMPFTPAVSQPFHGDHLWDLISHLRMNHLSIGADMGKTLCSVLRLYVLRADADSMKLINSIKGIEAIPSMCRVREGGWTAATDINIKFTQNTLTEAECFLFASVLNEFLGLYTSINTFTHVTAWMENRTDPIVRFPNHPPSREPL